jgi:hypothetical protein
MGPSPGRGTLGYPDTVGAGYHRRPQHPFHPIVGGLDRRLLQETQQVTPPVVAAQHPRQLLVVRVFQGPVPQVVAQGQADLRAPPVKLFPVAVAVLLPQPHRQPQ